MHPPRWRIDSRQAIIVFASRPAASLEPASGAVQYVRQASASNRRRRARPQRSRKSSCRCVTAGDYVTRLASAHRSALFCSGLRGRFRRFDLQPRRAIDQIFVHRAAWLSSRDSLGDVHCRLVQACEIDRDVIVGLSRQSPHGWRPVRLTASCTRSGSHIECGAELAFDRFEWELD